MWEVDELGRFRRCLNCGLRVGSDMPLTKAGKADELVKRVDAERVKDPSGIVHQDSEGEQDPGFEVGQPCAAPVRGGGTCKTTRIYGELYCKRHLDSLKEIVNVKLREEPTISCSVAGCKKPKCAESVQCERHYKKALRNNTKYRVRAKQAMNGTAAGSWKDIVMSKLLEQREIYVKKVADIDQTMTAVKGL